MTKSTRTSAQAGGAERALDILWAADSFAPIPIQGTGAEFEARFAAGAELTVRVAGSAAPDAPADAAVLALTFWDGQNQPIREPVAGLRWSSNLDSAFAYLPGERASEAGNFLYELTVRAPAGSARATLRLAPWRKTPVVLNALSVLAGGAPARLLRAMETREATSAKLPGAKRVPVNKETKPVRTRVSPGETRTLDYVLVDRAPQPAAVLCQLRFLDRAGAELDDTPAGLSRSDRYGVYKYLTAHAIERLEQLKFEIPPRAAAVEVSFRPWKSRTAVLYTDARLQRPARTAAVAPRSGVEVQLKAFQRAVSGSKADQVLVIYTGTKALGLGARANRSMMFAREAARLGIPTLYVYWRDHEDEAIPAAEPLLVQIPHDRFSESFDAFSRLKTGARKVMLSSFPDVVGCKIQDLFARNGWRVVAEVRDDWAEFQAAGQARWFHPSFERRIAMRADHTVTVSDPLRQKIVGYGVPPEKVSVVPNGTTDAFLQVAGQPAVARDRSVIGYFGHLTAAWFDWGLLAWAAERRPDLRFEIIGFDPPRNLYVPPNVAYLGAKTHPELIAHCRTWGAAIIPFKIGKLTRAVDPIKVYEYLALGLPVVSAPMGALDATPGVHVYRSEEDFVACLDRARTSDLDPDETKQTLRGASWRERLLDVLALSGEGRSIPDERDHEADRVLLRFLQFRGRELGPEAKDSALARLWMGARLRFRA